MKKLKQYLLLSIMILFVMMNEVKAQNYSYQYYNYPGGSGTQNYQQYDIPGFSFPQGQFYYYNGSDPAEMMNQFKQLLQDYFYNNSYGNNFYFDNNYNMPESFFPDSFPGQGNQFMPFPQGAQEPSIPSAPSFEEAPDLYY